MEADVPFRDNVWSRRLLSV